MNDLENSYKEKILIVDDHATNLNVLTDLVISLGYEPFCAHNGKEALEILHRDSFDLMLLDIMMPVMNGFEVLEALKANGKIFEFPVIVVSALDDLDNIARCILLGADDYLIKPFHSTLLMARIRSSLDKKQYRDRQKQIIDQLGKSCEALKKIEELRNDLTSMLVHDLNSPLTAIKGYSQYLQIQSRKTTLNKEDFLDSNHRILEAVYDMESLIRGILDSHKIEQGAMTFDITPVPCVKSIREVFERFVINKNKNRSFEFEVKGGEVLILADIDLLNRVIQNLLMNAYKFTSTEHRIRISITEHKEEVEICVEDTGNGIQPEYMDKLFTKFFQAEGRKKGKKYGFGLGLYFCKKAVEGMKGKISCVSEPGKGAAFTVTMKKSLPSEPVKG